MGLITSDNRTKFPACLVTREGQGRVVRVLSCAGDWPGDGPKEGLTLQPPVPVTEGPGALAVEVDGARPQFFASDRPVGPVLDALVCSDDGGRGEQASFTGALVGLVAHALTGQGWSADFDHFDDVPGLHSA